MRQFGRQAVLQVGQPGSKGREWRDLRIAFDVQHTRGRSPNSATIRVYNLSEASIAAFRRDGALVRLLAGYEPEAPQLIFQGTVVDGGLEEKKKTVDRILKVEAQDGGRAIKSTRLNYAATTASNYRQVVERLAGKLDGIDVGRIDVPNDVELPRGAHISGPARDVLDRIAEGAGADWSIQDGKLRLIAKGDDTGQRGALFSSTKGNLVGEPTKTDSGVEVTGLLVPSLRPGDRFKLESAARTGIYRARGVQFQGDNWTGKKFYVKTTGVPV